MGNILVEGCVRVIREVVVANGEVATYDLAVDVDVDKVVPVRIIIYRRFSDGRTGRGFCVVAALSR